MTIGHSTRSARAFLSLLRAHGAGLLVDVRRIPRSRRHPQFGGDRLRAALARLGIEYVHMLGLGGLRRPRKDSPNTGWRNVSFRGFADYMQTPEFEESLRSLVARARRARVVMMCAEAVPWRCHRSLIADALMARGVRVEHIMSATRRQPHAVPSWARIRGPRVTYPAGKRVG